MLVNQHVVLARLMFQRLHFFYNYLILNEKFRAGLIITFNQCTANKYFTRLEWVYWPVVNAALWHDGQAIQRNAFVRGHHGAILLPMRIEVMTLDHFARDALDPIGIDFRHAARVESRRFNQFCCHHPFWLCLT